MGFCPPVIIIYHGFLFGKYIQEKDDIRIHELSVVVPVIPPSGG